MGKAWHPKRQLSKRRKKAHPRRPSDVERRGQSSVPEPITPPVDGSSSQTPATPAAHTVAPSDPATPSKSDQDLWVEIERRVPVSHREDFKHQFLERTGDLHELDEAFLRGGSQATDPLVFLEGLPGHALRRFDLIAEQASGLAFPTGPGPGPDPRYKQHLSAAYKKTLQNAIFLASALPVPADRREDILTRLDLSLVSAVERWLGKAVKMLLSQSSATNADMPSSSPELKKGHDPAPPGDGPVKVGPDDLGVELLQGLIATNNKRLVDAYIHDVKLRTGKVIMRADIWKPHYKEATEFERWQRGDPRTTHKARRTFERILQEKPHLK
jgi:hypothetical protein